MEIQSITNIAIRNHLKGTTLTKQYREHLSNFTEWAANFNEEKLIYPGNFGEHMSIDEVALKNGELYTIITNKAAKGRKGCLAALIKGTKASVVSELIMKNVPFNIRMKVKEVTLDLANTMDWICRQCFPNAIKTADRFHFQKVVTEAVQDVRIALRREATDEENELIVESRKKKKRYIPKIYSNGDTKKQLLARSRHFLFKAVSKWSDSQRERAKILFEAFPTLKSAYMASIKFRNIFETSKSRKIAQKRLHLWYEEISQLQIPELISAGNTIVNHEGKILNYFHSGATNASAESFNAKLKGFRALLRGVRDINFFLFRLESLFA